jgi:sugar phosphate isomerase/epimerase
MVKPKIGISMLYCLGKSFKEMTKNLTTVSTAYVEIVDEGFHTLTKQRVSTLKTLGKSYNKKYTVHAPFADINIASLSKPILKTVFKRLETSISFTSDLDASVWVFHPGLRTGISMFYPGMDWIQNLETIRTLLKIANNYNVKIAIENVPEPYPFLTKNIEDFKKFYEELDVDIGLVFDVGHANLNKQMDQFLTVFGDKIVHIHAHDNRGGIDEHLGVGQGSVDWKSFADGLKRINFDKIVIVESVEHVEESVQKLSKWLS